MCKNTLRLLLKYVKAKPVLIYIINEIVGYFSVKIVQIRYRTIIKQIVTSTPHIFIINKASKVSNNFAPILPLHFVNRLLLTFEHDNRKIRVRAQLVLLHLCLGNWKYSYIN